MVEIAVHFLQLLIDHELNGSMGCPKETRQVAFVQPPHPFITKQVDKPISKARVAHVAGNISCIGEAQTCLHHPDRVGKGQCDHSCMKRKTSHNRCASLECVTVAQVNHFEALP